MTSKRDEAIYFPPRYYKIPKRGRGRQASGSLAATSKDTSRRVYDLCNRFFFQVILSYLHRALLRHVFSTVF